MEPQVKSIEPTGHDEGTTLDLNQPEDSSLSLTTAEVPMDVAPTVEKPIGGDTEALRDDDDESIED